MTPEAIMLTIRAGFEFGTELLRYLQTPEGQAVVRKSLEDRAAWDKFWQDVGDGLKKFFTGELFHAQPK